MLVPNSVVIPGRREAVSFDAQLRIRESITTTVSMDSGLAPRGAPRNDEGEVLFESVNHDTRERRRSACRRLYSFM